jgi:hypothetical protein
MTQGFNPNGGKAYVVITDTAVHLFSGSVFTKISCETIGKSKIGSILQEKGSVFGTLKIGASSATFVIKNIQLARFTFDDTYAAINCLVQDKGFTTLYPEVIQTNAVPEKLVLGKVFIVVASALLASFCVASCLSNSSKEVTEIPETQEVTATSPAPSSSTKVITKHPPSVPEPAGDNRKHYDWLNKECEVTLKMMEETGYKLSGEELRGRSFCTEAEEMRERITGVLNSGDPGAHDF